MVFFLCNEPSCSLSQPHLKKKKKFKKFKNHKKKGGMLIRPLKEYSLVLADPFHRLRDEDCIGAYTQLVKKKGFFLFFFSFYTE